MDVVHDDRASINVEDEEDRISNLPDDIVHRILSFLDMKYAVQTSALSKKWKHVWTSMPHLNLNNQTFGTFPQFGKFMKHALSRRNHHTEVSAVKLSFTGPTTHFTPVVKNIFNYANVHNIRHLTMIWFNSSRSFYRMFPQYHFSSRTLKHLTLAVDKICRYRGRVPIPTWNFPALETLSLRNMHLDDTRGIRDKRLNFFSKCVNLKDITLHRCSMNHLDYFNDCARQLTNLTIEDPIAGGYKPNSAWDFQALETLKLSNMQLNDIRLNLFSKCVNLKDLTLHRCSARIDAFDICAPQLSNLTITDPYVFPKVFNVVAPQLKNLTASVNTTTYRSDGINFLQLSIEGLNSLEKVNLHMSRSNIQKMYVPQLLNLFQKLCSAKFLILDLYIIQALSSCLDILSHEPCPFNNLKCLKIDKQNERIVEMPAEVRNYFLESSPSTTFIIDLPQVPQKRSRNDVDKGTMSKKLANSKEEKQQSKIMTEEYRSGSSQEAPSFPDQLSHEPSSFKNLKCLNQMDPIPRIPAEVRNHLFESSPSATSIMDLSRVPHKRSREEVDEGTVAKKVSNVIKAQQKKSREEVDKSTMVEKAPFLCTDRPSHEPSPLNNLECLNQTDCIPRMPIEVDGELLESPPSASFNMDLPQVPHKRSRHGADNGTMASTSDKEKQQTKTVEEENRMLEAKIVMQDELIAEKAAKLEAMKVQNKKRMLEEKILMQNKIIAHQKLEEKMQMQDKVIAEQKVMLETMRLKNEMKMFEAKILSQDKIISEQNAMLEAMKLQHENI